MNKVIILFWMNTISDSVEEKRLHKLGLLFSHPSEQVYFRRNITVGPIDDDHMPFFQQGKYGRFSF